MASGPAPRRRPGSPSGPRPLAWLDELPPPPPQLVDKAPPAAPAPAALRQERSVHATPAPPLTLADDGLPPPRTRAEARRRREAAQARQQQVLTGHTYQPPAAAAPPTAAPAPAAPPTAPIAAALVGSRSPEPPPAAPREQPQEQVVSLHHPITSLPAPVRRQQQPPPSAQPTAAPLFPPAARPTFGGEPDHRPSMEDDERGIEGEQTRRLRAYAEQMAAGSRPGPAPASQAAATGSAARAGTAGWTVHPRRLSWPLHAAAGVLLLWAALALVDLASPLAAALTSLLPVLSLVAVPVLAVAVARREVPAALVALLVALLPWVLVGGASIAAPVARDAPAPTALRILTVDGHDLSATALVRAVRAHQVNVVVITSLSATTAHDLTRARLDSVVPARWVSMPTSGRDGVGLWSQAEVSAVRQVPGTDDRARTTVLDIGGQKLTLLAAHAGGTGLVPPDTWHDDLAALDAVAPTGRRVLVGDLGASTWHPAVRALATGRWQDAADVLGRGMRPTWPNWALMPLVPLDQVLVGGGVGVHAVQTVAITGGPRRALLVDVTVPPRGAKTSAGGT